MTTILLMACIGMITGLFILFNISPMEFTDSLFKNLTSKPRSIKDEINETTKRKKMSLLRKEIFEVEEILRITGRKKMFPMLCALSLLLFSIGASISIIINNFFLLPVMAIGFMFIPFWYVRLTQTHFKKAISAELETALSIITTAYLRNEDIVTAVEENIDYLNPPVLSVFKEFISRVRLINPDITASLQDMKQKIDNAVFHEWCDVLIACQFDRSLKTTLTPIVSKLFDMRVVNGELENMVFEPRKEFITMEILVLGNIPLLYFLNKSWYHTLMHTIMGQIVLALCFTAIFISTAFVIKLAQPIEYRR
ncbi:type II secretion system F family protein [Sporanaerobacter acetigenes]|uniref:type II secretion system F family protein n=1 Tax=Sporanaerobacter acetigenes TaxID=165813 RepID=UPI001046F535|nr:hypothetical protein [Sporanaerobacter acetigenes]